MNQPTRDQNKFIVRMPDGLRDRIAETARVNGRSMNSEIVATLMDAYPEVLPEARRLYARVHEIAKAAGTVPWNELHEAIHDYIGLMNQAEASEIESMRENPFPDV